FLFRAAGARVRFPGFLALYREAAENGEENGEAWLPALSAAQPLRLLEVQPGQHFTQPPPRYTEASLVRALEELGIGRPSTYAPTLETIKSRGYVHMQERRLAPTDLGMLVTDLLVEHFPDIVDLDFTAQMEEELDEIAEGRRDWVKVVREFYAPFERDLQRAEKQIVEVEFPEVETGEACPECGRPLVRKHGRFGEFIACSGYPECRYTRPVGIGVACPRCGGEIVARRTRRGRTFYGCATYPACTFTSWDRPVDRPCPRCGSLMVSKPLRRGPELRCTNAACGHREPAEPAPASGDRAPATAGAGPPGLAH
ncbi:MAG: topoisomerase DNA-binding C4 zinc finger domain-containing protein, partial [Burkholderiales bacterium]|nr:topoisomerase DNA-binding C4 zinc finger domain-containing protein [Burkholderiales bacterium]